MPVAGSSPLLARKRKSWGRYLQVAEKLLEVNADEDDPFEARHVNGFLAALSRRGVGGNTLRWNYYVIRTFFRVWPRPAAIILASDEASLSPVNTV